MHEANPKLWLRIFVRVFRPSKYVFPFYVTVKVNKYEPLMKLLVKIYWNLEKFWIVYL